MSWCWDALLVYVSAIHNSYSVWMRSYVKLHRCRYMSMRQGRPVGEGALLVTAEDILINTNILQYKSTISTLLFTVAYNVYIMCLYFIWYIY